MKVKNYLLIVSVLMSLNFIFFTPAFAIPIFSQNATFVSFNGSYFQQGSSVYDKNTNISFQVNITESTNPLGGISTVILRLQRPSGMVPQLLNYTNNFTEGTFSTPQIMNVSTLFFINFTQDLFGIAGTYQIAWYAYNTTQATNNTAGGFFVVNKSAAAITTILINDTPKNIVAEKGSVVNLTVTTNATDSAITNNMTLFANFTGTNQSLPVINGTNAIYNITNTSSLTLGNYTVSANISTTQNYTNIVNNTLFLILIDTTPPTISGFTISPSSTTSGSSVTISASIFDLDSQTNTINITKPDGTVTTSSFISPSTFSDTSQTGTYNVTLQSKDNSNNKATVTGTFTVTSAASTGGGGGGGGGGLGTTTTTPIKETKTINIVTNSVNLTLNNFATHGVVEINIQVINPANNVQISVEKLESKPATVTQEVSGVVYRYLNITSDITDVNIKSTKIKFQVNKFWVTQNNFSASDIVLERYHNGTWQELPTSLVSSDQNTYTFEATSSGLSIYAITGKVIMLPKEVTTPTTPKTLTVFAEMISVIAIIAVIALIILRKGKKLNKRSFHGIF